MVFIVTNVVKVSNRRNGNWIQKRLHSNVNVCLMRKFCIYGTLSKYHVILFLACNCFGHSNDCKYDEEVDRHGLSIDINGNYAGGGVCQNCQHNTMGINCNKCKDTFYRPRGRYWNETDVCQRKNSINFMKYFIAKVNIGFNYF